MVGLDIHELHGRLARARLVLGVVFRPEVSGLVVEASCLEGTYDSFGVKTAGVDANHVFTPLDDGNVMMLYPAFAASSLDKRANNVIKRSPGFWGRFVVDADAYVHVVFDSEAAHPIELWSIGSHI